MLSIFRLEYTEIIQFLTILLNMTAFSILNRRFCINSEYMPLYTALSSALVNETLKTPYPVPEVSPSVFHPKETDTT